MRQVPELLAPAGDLEKLKIAVLYGADAVYCSGKSFGLRAGAGNLGADELQEGLAFAHQRGRKVYVTVNIIPHNRDLQGMSEYLRFLGRIGIDALIASDPGVVSLAREAVPQIPLHLSTQANAVNWRSVQFWREQGVQRVILARELARDEIAEIRRNTAVELEVFVHGAMCMAYSGRCLMSMYLAGRDANRGDCAQPCRWQYRVVEEKRPGEYLSLEEEERGTFIFNSKDLCLLDYVPDLVELGLTSLKIEGRMKGIHYVGTVTRVYRQALDAYRRDPEGFRVRGEWRKELEKVSHRDYTTGFFCHPPTAADHVYGSSSYIRKYDFIGIVKDYEPKGKQALLEQRNPFAVGERVEVVGPGREAFSFVIKEMFAAEDGTPLKAAPHPQQLIWVPVPKPLHSYDLVRRVRERD